MSLGFGPIGSSPLGGGGPLLIIEGEDPTVTSVTISPSNPTVAGGGNQTFTALVEGTGSFSQSVTWSATAGSINSGGVFTAPAATNNVQTITITATSNTDNTKSGTTVATVAAIPVTVSSVTVSPSSITMSGGGTQTFTALVVGTGGFSQAVTWSSNFGSINSSGLFTAPAATTSIRTITITATSVTNGSRTGTATVTIPALPFTVSSVVVSPPDITMNGDSTQNFTAFVYGTGNFSQSVTWSSNAGSIDSNGLFTAPAATENTQQVIVTATSVTDNTRSDTSVVTVSSNVDPEPPGEGVRFFFRNMFR